MPVSSGPVASITWGTALPNTHVTVYFVPSGDTLGGYTSEGISAYEIAQFEALFDVVSDITNVTFEIVSDPDAVFRILVDDDEVLGEFDGMMGPPGEANAGEGIFNREGVIRAPGGALDQGGYDFMVFTHEFMHAMGLSHPHDDGGGSPIMNGVDDAFDDYGDHDLNQGTYTVMTYNNGYFTGTQGSRPDPDHLYGYEAGPMALDIAVLQSLYGANMTTATGDNVYLLPDANVAGTKWVAIWDADEIQYDGGRDAVIDLRPATLLYEPGGGGWVSSADGIAGGYTIANGVTVEAATGGSGDDVLTGNDAGNLLSGRAGADWIRGNGGDDTVLGGAGNDTLFGGAGADEISGGSGDDLFLHDLRADAFGDAVDGGDGSDDHDVLDLRGHGPFRITKLKDDPQDAGAQRGTVEFLDGSGDVEGTLDFSGIETIQLCFASGVGLLTPSGEKPVEEIAAGDRVVTRDNGTQTVRWVGRDVVSADAMRADPGLRPIRIRAGALGPGVPVRDMVVSANHRILLAGSRPELLFSESEVLVAAKHLVGQPGIERILPKGGGALIHVLFDRHEIVLGDGCWSESFLPGPWSIAGMGAAARGEIFGMFPELASRPGEELFHAARRDLRRAEAGLVLA